MRGKEKKPVEVPAIEQVRAERERLRYRRRYRQTLRSTANVLIVVAALAVLAATVLTPVLQIYGSSMTPTLSEGDIVVSLKGADFQQAALPDRGSGWISTPTARSMSTASSSTSRM